MSHPESDEDQAGCEHQFARRRKGRRRDEWSMRAALDARELLPQRPTRNREPECEYGAKGESLLDRSATTDQIASKQERGVVRRSGSVRRIDEQVHRYYPDRQETGAETQRRDRASVLRGAQRRQRSPQAEQGAGPQQRRSIIGSRCCESEGQK